MYLRCLRARLLAFLWQLSLSVVCLFGFRLEFMHEDEVAAGGLGQMIRSHVIQFSYMSIFIRKLPVVNKVRVCAFVFMCVRVRACVYACALTLLTYKPSSLLNEHQVRALPPPPPLPLGNHGGSVPTRVATPGPEGDPMGVSRLVLGAEVTRALNSSPLWHCAPRGNRGKGDSILACLAIRHMWKRAHSHV